MAANLYRSQYEQDKHLYETYFTSTKNGVFVDVGAYDGEKLSNTYFFEKALGWKGVCIEPIRAQFEAMEKVRGCTLVWGCAYDVDGTVEFRHVEGAPEMLSGVDQDYDPRHRTRIDKEVFEDASKAKQTVLQIPAYRLDTLL